MYQKHVHQSLRTETLKYASLVPKVRADTSKLPVVKTAPRAFSYLQSLSVRWLRSRTKYSDSLESTLLDHNVLILNQKSLTLETPRSERHSYIPSSTKNE